MSKVAQIYNMSANEAFRLTDAQTKFLSESADLAAQQLFNNSPEFRQALQQKLSGVKRTVRSMLGEGDGSGDTTNPLGPPPDA
jgi:hypothetical protein